MLTCVVGGVVLGGIVLYVLYRKVIPRTVIRRDYPADVVVLRQVGRGPFAPSMSPFPLKVETYLRMAKIPHESDHKSGMSPDKGKTPWISYNNEDVSDSQICIEYLNKKLDVDVNSHLSDPERAVARAFRIMTEEHLYWAIVLQRWLYDKDKSVLAKALKMPTMVIWIVSRMVAKMGKAHGMGRHSMEQVLEFADANYRALSKQIGNRPFLMGSEPCEEDCAIFGMLAQSLWQMPGTPHEKFVTKTYPNLAAYCERMKARFWPDWDEYITHDGTKQPTK